MIVPGNPHRLHLRHTRKHNNDLRRVTQLRPEWTGTSRPNGSPAAAIARQVPTGSKLHQLSRFLYDPAMSTNPGQSVGPYTVSRELGRGGMGVVYLAQDTRLGRQVAIKALPEHLAADPDRLARFQREARVLASLNHPNIAGIHGLEEAGGQHFLVLEYVEGESLDAVLERGPMSIEDAIDTAVAIANALEAAHDKGIVHRDLKPANIMLTREGVPKVLDFGLARQSDEAQSSTTVASESITLTSPVQLHSPTMPGVIMGTAGYMSPEQARGRPVDKRSDIFSFGCVLYELLTGSRPFAGESMADVLGATLHKELDLSLLPSSTPSKVRRVLTRCLEKDKRNRLHDIADARIELQSDESSELSVLAVPTRAGGSRAALVVSGIILVVAAGLTGWLVRPGAGPSAPVVSPQVVDAEILLPEGKRLGHAFHPGVGISDDGTMIVFPINDQPDPDAEIAADRGGWANSTGLVVRRVDTAGLSPVTGAGPGSLQSVFSPDGRWIAYVNNGNEVMKIPIAGGRPVRLATSPEPVVGLDWHTDGFIYIGLRDGGGIHRVSEAGGEPAAVTTPNRTAGETAHALPAALPSGGLLFTVYTGDYDTSSIAYAPMTGEVSEAAHTRIVDDASQPRYARNHMVFAREGALFAMPFDTASPGTAIDPSPLPERVVHSKYFGNMVTMTHAAQFDLSPSGTLVIVEGDVPGESLFSPVWVDTQGQETPVDIEPGSYLLARPTGENGRLMFVTGYGPTRSVWVHEPDRGITRRIVRPADIWFAPGPGPSEVTLLLDQDNSERPVLGILDIDVGPASFRPLGVPDDLSFNPAQWSPDGRYLVGIGQRNQADAQAAPMTIWVHERGAGWTALSNSAASLEGWPSISPDGRWIVYAVLESGRVEIYARPFNRPGRTQRVSPDGGIEPRWSPDGSEIFYRELSVSGIRPGRNVLSVAVAIAESDPEQLTLGRPVMRFQTQADYVAVVPITSWDFAPDGRAMFIRMEDPVDRHKFMQAIFPDRLRIIHNWTSRL